MYTQFEKLPTRKRLLFARATEAFRGRNSGYLMWEVWFWESGFGNQISGMCCLVKLAAMGLIVLQIISFDVESSLQPSAYPNMSFVE